MSRTLRLLSIVLLVQLLLAAVLLWQQQQRQQQASSATSLLSVDLKQADQLLIEGEGRTLNLKRDGERWRLPDYGNLFVNDSRIDELRDKLTAASSSWPVASTANAASRFEVASDKFQRKLVYRKGDEVLATIYLGSAPTFRKLHARVEGSDAVHAIELTLNDAPTDAKIWFDKTVQQLKSPAKALTAGTVALLKEGDSWQFGDGSPADNEAAERFVKRFADLYVTDWLSDDKAKAILAKPVHYKASLTTADGEVSYSFYRDGEQTYVNSSLHPALFAMATFVAEPIWNTTADSLKPKPAAAEPASSPSTELVEGAAAVLPAAEPVAASSDAAASAETATAPAAGTTPASESVDKSKQPQ